MSDVIADYDARETALRAAAEAASSLETRRAVELQQQQLQATGDASKDAEQLFATLEGRRGGAEDLELDDIDFEWTKRCSSSEQLVAALRLLKGQPYVELERAVRKRLSEVDPSAPHGLETPEERRARLKAADEFTRWAAEAGSRDAELARAAAAGGESSARGVPPVRGSAPKAAATGSSKKAAKAARKAAKASGESARRLPPVEARAAAENEKAKGVESFKAGEHAEAVRYFTAALKTAPAGMEAALLNNRAAAYLQLGQHENAAKDCDRVLAAEPGNVKALFRRGTARQELYRYDGAVADFSAVLAVLPRNGAAQEGLAAARRSIAQTVGKGGEASGKKKKEEEDDDAAAPAKSFKRLAVQEVDDDSSDDEEEEDEIEAAPAAAAAAPEAEVDGEALAALELGRALFQDGDFADAAAAFEDSIRAAPAAAAAHRARCFSNLAACRMQQGETALSVEAATAGLAALGESGDRALASKLLLRRALAREAAGEAVQALADARKAAETDASSKAAAAAVARLSAAPPAAAPASAPASAPAAGSPQSQADFEAAWQADPGVDARYAVLRAIEPSALPGIFSFAGALSAEHLDAMVRVVDERYVAAEALRAADFLENLARTARFDLNFMLCSAETGRRVKSILKKLAAAGVAEPRVEGLRKAFA